jgi:PAS domain S-box-containing protein
MTNKTRKKDYKQGLNLNNDEEDKINRLEVSLKEKDDQFIEAQSIANFGFWEIDPVTQKSTWTEGVFKILGLEYKNEQLDYFVLKELIHPQDRDLFYNAKENVIKMGIDIEFDIRMIKPDSSMRDVHIIAKPKKDEIGKIVGIRGTAQDITDLKKVEKELKESETFYRTLFENTGTASIIIDENTTLLMVNTQFEKLSGYSKEEIECKMSWKELVSKEDIRILEKYHVNRRNNNETPPENYEARFLNKEGNTRIVLIDVAIIPGTKRSIVSLLDLTERKKMEKELADSERRYRYMVEKATSGMFILDKNGIIKYLNEHMAYILGYSVNEMLEKDIKNFVDETENFSRPKKSSKNQIERYNWFKFLQKQGDVFWSNLTVTTIFNSKKEYTGCLGIVSDINMQKGLEESFLEREEVFTDVIYDMMEMLNNIAKEKNKSETEADINLDNN